MKEYNFSMQLYFSKESECWIALSPEFPGSSCFGDTREEAIREFESILSDLCDIAGDEIPEPITFDEYGTKELPLQPKFRMK